MNQDRKALLYIQFFRKSHIEIRLHSLTRGTNHGLIGAARATAIWKVFAPPFFYHSLATEKRLVCWAGPGSYHPPRGKSRLGDRVALKNARVMLPERLILQLSGFVPDCHSVLHARVDVPIGHPCSRDD